MSKKNIAAAAALAVALIALPNAAHASSFGGGNVTVGDTTNGADWQIYDDGSIDHSYVYTNGDTFDRVVCGTYGGLLVDGNSFSVNGSGTDIVTDSNNDQVITGTGTFSTTSSSLDAVVEYRLYAEGDLLRTSYVLTNNTSSAITFTPSVYEDPTDNNSDSATSTSGDNLADTNDTWYTTFDSTTPSAVYSKFWGVKPTALNGFEFNSNESSEEVDFATVTIQPGASYDWIFFHSYKSYSLTGDAAAIDAAASAAGAAAVAEFADNGSALPSSGRIIRGLDLTMESNWHPAVAPTPAPTLASTGSDFTGIVALGGAFLVGGAVALMRRRKTNA